MENDFFEKVKIAKDSMKTKNFMPLYFVYGEEPFFIGKLESYLIKTFDDKMGVNVKVYNDDNFNIDEVVKYMSNMPFMNEKKLIIFKNIDFFNKKTEKKKIDGLIESIIANISINVILFIMYESERKYEDKYNKNNKLIDLCLKYGIVIDSKKLNEGNLIKYIEDYFEKAGVEISKVEVLSLIKNAGKNLINLFNESDKILNYIGDRKKVEGKDIEECVTKNIEENVFKLIDFINTNRQNEALILYSNLIGEGTNCFAIFSILINSYKDLLVVKTLVEESKSIKEISEITKIQDWKIKNMINSSKGLTKDTIKRKISNITKLSIEHMDGDINESLMLELLFY